jgi:tetratricopeptide (TPR) repeat protein
MGHSKPLSAPPPDSEARWVAPGICLLLAALVWIVFGQTLGHRFVNFDDDAYVYENPMVKGGLTPAAIAWAFTHKHQNNWHPLTSLSHILDCQLYGLNAGGHHLTNVLLHGATAILLFLVLRRMTAALWPSALVAVLFAIHPLRVESVAWVSERKDVLSGLFFVLTIWAYARYVEVRSPKSKVQSPKSKVQGLKSEARNPKPEGNPNTEYRSPKPDADSTPCSAVPSSRFEVQRSTFGLSRHPPSSIFYLLSLCFFACGLMSKPMLVTLPFVLLLLDYWPLGRGAEWGMRNAESGKGPGKIRRAGWGQLLLEKIPLLALSAASCVITLLVQGEAIHGGRFVPIRLRIENAIVSGAVYLGQMVYPRGLAIGYPYPRDGLPVWEIALALLVLGGVSVAAWQGRKQRPWLLTGWFWYLGMLVPVAGLVQVGQQARADRYTYLPQIGVYLLLTWTLVAWAGRGRNRRWVVAGGAVAGLVVLAACARVQTGYWRNSESLWTHTLACTTDNALAESNLGNCLYQEGRFDEALVHSEKALELQPDYVDANNCVGFILLQKGRVDEAIAHFRTALSVRPDYAPAHNNLGMALFQLGRVDEAIAQYRSALEANSTAADTHNNLGAALVQKGQFAEGVAHYQKALELRPDYPGACNNLAWVLATAPQPSVRDGVRAVQLARQANQLTGGGNLVVLRTLAAAYAEAGRFPEAIETANRALELATAQGNSAWADTLQKEIKLYQAASPLRDPLPSR